MRHEIIERALGEGASRDADAQTLAGVTATAVGRLLRELRPLVGELATSALYRRSLHLAKASFPRPVGAQAQTPEQLMGPLQQDLSARSPAEAQLAGRALLTALVDLLVSLIGEPLTHQLLGKAWGVPPSSEEKPK